MRIEYDFLRVGSSVKPRRGHIYLDIGNQQRSGIVDTHADELSMPDFVCSSTLVAERPELITDWISSEDLAGSVTVVVHENPDYDCVASSLLVRRLLEARASGRDLPENWNEWATMVADSASRVDRGETRIRLPIKESAAPITPYLAVIALDALAEREAVPKKEAWRRVIERGHDILDRAFALARVKGLADLDSTNLRGHLGHLGNLEAIVDQKVSAFERDAARIGLLDNVARPRGGIDGVFPVRLPLRDRVSVTVPAKVASIKDPECDGGFFKSVIRGAYAQTIDATCVFLTVRKDHIAEREEWVRPIVSLDPDSRFDLRGLGRHLDLLETGVRKEQRVPRLGPPRPGFDNSDPWYDGRAFAHTIVDAPRFGTILTEERVHEEVIQSQRWLPRRIAELIREMLQQVRAPKDTAARRKAFDSLAEGVGVWVKTPADRDPQLYREAIDALITLATSADAAAYRPLLDINEILLGFLTNDDPAVRTDALVAAGQRAQAVAAYAVTCGRKDVLSLITIAADVQEKVLSCLLVSGVADQRHQLLLDAVAARVKISGAEEPVVRAAAAIATRCVEAKLGFRSITHLRDVLRDASSPSTELLDPIARRIEAGSTASADSRRSRDPIRDFHQWLQDGKVVQAAQMLRAIISEDPASPVSLLRANDLLERVADLKDTTDELPACREVLTALQAAYGTTEIAAKLSEKAAQQALRIAPDFVGRLLRTLAFDGIARRLVIGAALDGKCKNAFAEARRFVLTPDDARIHAQCEDLITSAAVTRAAGAQPTVRRPQDFAFLLLSGLEARSGRSEAALLSLLSRIASSSDSSSVDDIARLRGHLEHLRQMLPDHILLDDAEVALAQVSTFAQTLALTMNDEATLGPAVTLLLRIAVALPEIDFDAVTRLARLERMERPEEIDGFEIAAFACAKSLGAITDRAVLVTDVHRIRAAATSIGAAAKSCPAASVGGVVQMTLRAAEAVLEIYAGVLDDRHKPESEIDDLSLRMLEASTITRMARDFPALDEKSRVAAVTLTSAVARSESEGPDAARRSLSRLRRHLGSARTPERGYSAAARNASAPASGSAVDRMYGRIRDMMSLPTLALDAAYVQIVDRLIRRYDMRRARYRIDEYSFGRIPPLLRFWMSGWTALAPFVVITLFAAVEAFPLAHKKWIVHGIETAIVVLFGSAAFAAVREWIGKSRGAGRSRSVESLRYKLFLPNYVLLVLFGVYTSAMTEEIASHMALELGDGRFAFVAAILFAGSAWALRQVIQRHGGVVTSRHVAVATGRLFAYAFSMALLFNIIVSPMVRYEVRLHERRLDWIGLAKESFTLLPDEVDVGKEPYGAKLYPRHILLNGLFGMFIGIFLRGFWKVSEKE